MELKTKSVISPIILSAGLSSRMKGFKPLLPLGDGNILERVINAFKDAGFDDIRAVVGYRADELVPILEKQEVRPILNRQFRKGMFSSVLAGVKDLSADCEAFFIMPVDIPLVRRHTFLELCRALKKGESKICYPCFRGERGHPPLIDARLVPEIVRLRDMDNLSLILNHYEASAEDVEVPDENILFDIDAPSDYRLLLKRHQRYRVPSREECLWFLEDKYRVNERILAHSRKVASLALTLGEALEPSASGLDLDVLYKASLLHDLMREHPRHALRGAEVLMEAGYPELAEIVAEHADISLIEDEGISEKEILYLADKLVQDDKVVSLDERFGKKLKKYGANPEIKKNIEKRKNKALKIKLKIEAILGKSVESILKDK